jgi:hypothetical protein
VTDLLGAGAVQGGAVTVVAAIVMLILRGSLVPHSVVRDLRADRDARVKELTAERDTWRAAHQASEEARHVAQAQVGELLELSRTADHLLRSLPRTPTTGVTSAPQAQSVATQG